MTRALQDLAFSEYLFILGCYNLSTGETLQLYSIASPVGTVSVYCPLEKLADIVGNIYPSD